MANRRRARRATSKSISKRRSQGPSVKEVTESILNPRSVDPPGEQQQKQKQQQQNKRLRLDPGAGDIYIGEWRALIDEGTVAVSWETDVETWISRKNPSDRFVSQLLRIREELSQKNILLSKASWDYIKDRYERTRICRGEQIGVVAAQSLSERFTQSCLNTFHLAGAKKSAVVGMARIMELLRASKKISVPAIGPLPSGKFYVEQPVSSLLRDDDGVAIDWCEESNCYVLSMPVRKLDLPALEVGLAPLFKRWIGDKPKQRRSTAKRPTERAISMAQKQALKHHISGNSWIDKIYRAEDTRLTVQVRKHACPTQELAQKCLTDLIYKTMRFGRGMRVRDYMSMFEPAEESTSEVWIFHANCFAEVVELEQIMDQIADSCMHVADIVVEDNTRYELINASAGSSYIIHSDIVKAIRCVSWQEEDERLLVHFEGSHSNRSSIESFFHRKILGRPARGLQSARDFECVGGDDQFTILFDPAAGRVPCKFGDLAESVLEDLLSATDLDEVYDLYMNKVASTDTHFIAQSLGIEAARAYLVKEMARVLSAEGIDVASKHIDLIIDNMTGDGELSPNTFYGMDASSAPLLSITFERAFQTFRVVAENGGADDLRDPSSCVMMGKLPRMGTNYSIELICEPFEPLPAPPSLLHSLPFSPPFNERELEREREREEMAEEYIPAPDSPGAHAFSEVVIEPIFL